MEDKEIFLTLWNSYVICSWMTTTNIQEQLLQAIIFNAQFEIIPLFSFLHSVSLEAKASLPLPNSMLTAFSIHIFVVHETIL